MKNKLISFMLTISIIFMAFFLSSNKTYAASYLDDKKEEVVELDVAGAEALAQTDDGYVWIGQYSGLVRYDSKNMVTYNKFIENDVEYEVINIRNIISDENDLYILTYKNLFLYSNYTFKNLDLNLDALCKANYISSTDIECIDFDMDEENNIIYICSNLGIIIYDVTNKTSTMPAETAGKRTTEIVVDTTRSCYYYNYNGAIYTSNGHKTIVEDVLVLDLYIYDNNLLIGLSAGLISYNLEKNKLDTSKFSYLTDQVNIMIYSSFDDALFVGCNKEGVYCINLSTNKYSIIDNLKNKIDLVDLLVDYEGNLWVASHNVSNSGVSIITKNDLSNLLYSDVVWNKFETKPTIYAIERYLDTLYIATNKGLFFFDLYNNCINPQTGNNAVMDAVEAYYVNKGYDIEEDAQEFKYDFRNVEVLNNKLYFLDYGLGLIEYDPATFAVTIYDYDYLSADSNINKIIEAQGKTILMQNIVYMRSIKAFDDYLVIGCQGGILIKFKDGKSTIYNIGKTILYINSNDNGDILFNHTQGIFKIDQAFENVEEIATEKTITGNRLKFFSDGDSIYYNLNSRFFRADLVDGSYVSTEIVIPYIKGSIVELAKIKYKDTNNNEVYKYVIASTSQIYITDSLDSSNLDEYGKLIKYDLYDSTNGLESIQANTSGYYDESDSKYYFQTTNGVLVYDFSVDKENVVPFKLAVDHVDVDGTKYYGNNISLNKFTNRLEIDLSILAFRPTKGYTIYCKLEGVDSDYIQFSDTTTNISYTNLSGGSYTFKAYVIDEYGQASNEISISINKPKRVTEEAWFWVLMIILAILLILGFNFIVIKRRTKKAEKRANEYREITVESIEAIARTIDAKDSYTNGHSKRVGIYSREIARALNLSQDEIDNIYYIALLHDIGKISIPLEIINKPGRLTDEEFEIMKTHTTAGAKILDGISTIPHIVEGAKYHHERYGGGGYPTGIKGEEIPFIARIICCADCYDAMATRRTYKEPYSKEKIISEFERCKNTQFDPKIADVVIKLIKEDRLRYGTELKEENKDKKE